MCPNTEVKFTCSQQSVRIIWTVPESLTDNTNSDTIPLIVHYPLSPNNTKEPYTAAVIEGNDSYILSELAITIPQQLNGIKEISCIPNAGNDEGKKTCMFKPAGVSNKSLQPHFHFVIIIPQ